MVVEKNLRGVLRSEVDRSVSRDSIIIVDSLNNIKVRPVLSPLFYCCNLQSLRSILVIEDISSIVLSSSVCISLLYLVLV